MIVVGSFVVSPEIGRELLHQQLDNRLHATLEQIPLPVISMDLDGAVRYLNRSAGAYLGIDPEAAQGRTLDEVYPSPMTEGALSLCRNAIESSRLQSGVIRGDEHLLDAIAVPMVDGFGTVYGVINLFWDAKEDRSWSSYLSPRPSADGSGCWVPVFIPGSA
jgi:PAS domain S-box-containing protein